MHCFGAEESMLRIYDIMIATALVMTYGCTRVHGKMHGAETVQRVISRR